MLAIPPCGASSNIALWRAKIKPPVELVVGDLDKLLEICDFFSCKMDELVRKSLSENESIYFEVRVQTVKPFKMARYVIFHHSQKMM